MALVLKDRVKEITSTTGTADFVLGGASSGYQTFSVVGNGNTTYYAAFDSATGDWEVGIGTYSTTGPTLTRDTVLESNNAGSKVVFAAGPKDVFLTYPAERAVYLDAAGSAVSILDIGTLGVSTANISTANITSGTVSTTPTNSTDIANKTYVDTLVSSGITYHTPVKYEVPDATGNLNATYNNGTSGVGATLTNAGALAAFTPDGTVASVSDRILVYSQTSQAQNGVYVVTTVGSGSVAWVLTRASDANTYALKSSTALGEGDAFFITSGNSGAGETYVCNTVGVITFGTTAITFAQISSAQIYSAGTGLTLTGTQFSITNTAVTANTYGSGSSVPVFSVNAQGQITSATPTAIAIAVAAVSGLAASATTDTTNASNISSGTLGTARLSGSYTGITGVGTLAAGTWNGSAIAAVYGGTGQTSYAVGDLVYANTTTTLAKLADVAVGNALISGGLNAAPSYGKIGLATHVSGTLPVANGGTGATDAAGIRTAAGATTVGGNVFTLTNPSAITFPRFNADNTVSALDAATFRTAIGAGTGAGTVTGVTGTAPVVSSGGTAPAISMAAASSGVNGYMTGTYATKLDGIAAGAQPGTVTSVSGTGTVSGLTLTGTVTSSGSLTLGGAIGTLNQNTTGNAATATTATNLSGGTVNATTGTFNGGTSLPLTLTTSSAGPWAIALTRSDLGMSSQVYNGTGTQWYFQHRPSFAGATPLDSSNYTSYSPSLTGSGASGTWGINVTGNAATATTATNQSGGTVSATTGAFTGRLTSTSGFTNADNALRIFAPGGGSYATGASTVTGAIKIRIPTAALRSNTMISFKVKVYQYNTGLSNEFQISGYNYSDAGASWINVAATALSQSQGALTVRFGFDGTSQCVYIGELASSWSYPQVVVTDFIGGYSAYTAALWASGWSVGFEPTAFAGLSTSTTAAATLNSSNYTSYAPSLTGSGASGTWGINVTGNAATATTASSANALNSANNYSVTRLTATPNTSGVSTGITAVNGDMTAYRTGGTTGVIYLSSSGSHYLYWDGTNYNLNSGNLICTGNITAYSDETLKTDWRDLPEDFLAQLAGLKHGIYTRIDSGDDQAGISAQKLQVFLPQVVQKDEKGKLSVAYGNAAMVSAVQLAKRVVEQDERIAKLEALVAKLTEGK